MSVNFVNSAGEVVSSTPAVSGLVVTSGADYDYVIVSSGGYTVDTAVANGGIMEVASAGNADKTVVENGGYIFLENGAVLNDITVEKGGIVNGFSFGTDKHWQKVADGRVVIGSKIIISENVMEVYFGGSASDITAEYAVININNGAELTNTVLNNYGELYVWGSAADTVVNAGGFAGIAVDADADGMTVNNEGYAFIFGNASNVNIQVGGYVNGFIFTEKADIAKMTNGVGELSKNVTMSYGDYGFVLDVASGGKVSGITSVDGVMFVRNGGSASNIENNTELDVAAGGSVSNVVNNVYFQLDGNAVEVTNNGTMTVGENGSVTDFVNNSNVNIAGSASNVVNSGTLNAASTAAVNGIDNDGIFNLEGIASDVTNRSVMSVKEGGSASDVNNMNGALATFAGNASNVNNAGTMKVSAGVEITDVENSGTFDLAGIASNVENSGNMTVFRSGAVTVLNNAEGGSVNVAGSASQVTNAGSMKVSSGAVITDVENNGMLEVCGSASNVVNSGDMIVNSDVSVKNIVNNGGSFVGRDNVKVDSFTVNDGNVEFGAAAELTADTVVNGGTVSFASNAVINNIVVNDGMVNVTSGGTVENAEVAGGVFSLVGNVKVGTLNASAGIVHISFETAVDSLTVAAGVDINGFIFSTEKIDGIKLENGIIAVDGNQNMIIENDRLSIRNESIDNLHVTSGHFYLENGSANSTVVDNVMRASAAAVVNDTMVNSGGMLYVDDAAASNTVVNYGGEFYASNGADVKNTTVNGGGKLYGEAGAVISGAVVADGGVINLGSGVKASDIDVAEGGILNLTAAKGTNVKGQMKTGENSRKFDMKNGIIESFTVIESAVLQVMDEGQAISTEIDAGGAVFVKDDGYVSRTIVKEDGFLHILDGGSAFRTSATGGVVIVSSGGSADTGVVESGGYMDVLAGGLIVSTIALNANMNIAGAANSNWVTNGTVNVLNGGSVVNTSQTGGVFNVSNGGATVDNFMFDTEMNIAGVANNNIVSGGVFNVSNGGATVDNFMFDTEMNIAGVANNNIVSGGVFNVLDGGSVESTIYTGSSFNVELGAVAVSNTIADAEVVIAGSAVNNVITDGTVEVLAGGYIENTEYKGVSFNVEQGAVAINNNASSAEVVIAGSAVDNKIIGGTLNILTGGYIENTEFDGKSFTVAENAEAISNIVTNAEMTVAGSAFDNTITDGSLEVMSGAYVEDTTLTNGVFVVNKGAEAANNIVTGSEMTVAGNAYNNTVTNGKLNVSGVVINNIIADTAMTLAEGAFAENTEIQANASVSVASGASISNTEIGKDGSLEIAAGGAAYNTEVYGEFVFDKDSIIEKTAVYKDASITVDGTITETSVMAGGSMVVNSSGTHRGKLFIEDETASVTIDGTLDFTLTDVAMKSDYIVNNLSYVNGDTSYTITIDQYQYGIYNLVQYAAGIDGVAITINVCDENDTVSEFTLTVNGEGYTCDVNGSRYKLDLNDKGDLTLTVGMPAPIFSPSTIEPTRDNVVLTVIYPVNTDNVEKFYRLQGSTEWLAYTGPIDVIDNATYEFYAKDGDFGSFISEYTVSNIDRSAPVVSVYGNFEDYGKEELLLYINVEDVSPYSIEYSFDSGVTWNTIYGNALDVAQDKHYVNFRVTDKAGNVTCVTENFFKKDEKPQISEVILSETDWTAENVYIAYKTDGDMLYSFDFGEKAENAVWFKADGPISVYENAVVYLKAVDKYGYESDVKEVVIDTIDTTAPVITATISETEMTKNDVIITLDIDENESGIKSAQYSLNNGIDWFTLKEDFIVIEKNCDVWVKVTDNAGNVTEYKTQINNIAKEIMDAPEVTASVTELTNSDVELTVAYSKYAVEKLFSYDKEIWYDYKESIIIEENTVIYFKSIDSTGAESEIIDFTVNNIDKIAPEVTIEGNSSVLTFDPVVLTVNAEDANEISKIEYTFDNKTWFVVENNQIVVTENGTVSVRVTDKAGNVTSKEVIVNNITAPEVEKIDSYNPRMSINNATDLTAVADVYSCNAVAKEKVTDTSSSYKYSVSAKGSLDISNKNTQAIDFNLFKTANVRDNAVVSRVLGGNESISNSTKNSKENTVVNVSNSSKTSAAGKLTVASGASVEYAENYSTVIIDSAAVDNLIINAIKETYSEKSVDGVVNSAASTFTKSAAGKVTLKNGASAGNIVNYNTVKLEAGSNVGNITLEVYTEKYTKKSGNEKTVRTVSRIGSVTAVDSLISGSISGYKTVKLTDTVVAGDIIISAFAKDENGYKTGKLTGSVTLFDSIIAGSVENYSALTLKNSSVNSVVNTAKVTASTKFSCIGSYIGTSGNDTLTIKKGAVLTLDYADFGEGSKDKLVINGTLVLGKAFDINAEAISGKGDIVAADNVWKNLSPEAQLQVLNLGNTVKNFVSAASEMADNTEKKAAKWDLKSDYNGWLGNGVDVDDTVDFIKFKNKQSGTLVISGSGFDVSFNGDDSLKRDAEGNFVIEFAADTNNILKLECRDAGSMSYSISLLA